MGLLLGAVGCGGDDPDDAETLIVGTWFVEQTGDPSLNGLQSITYEADGTCTEDTTRGGLLQCTWSIDGDKLEMDFEDDRNVVVYFTVSADQLVWIWGDDSRWRFAKPEGI